MHRDHMTVEQAAEPRFAVFRDAHWGFRALGLVLLNYEKLHGLNTIIGIINRWAPPPENQTEAYIKDVCGRTGFPGDHILDLKDKAVLASLAKAISTHEVGTWAFSDNDLVSGIALSEAA